MNNFIIEGSDAYHDYKNCVKILQNSDKELQLVFNDLIKPQRPQQYDENSFKHLYFCEKIKIKLIYHIWNGSVDVSVHEIKNLNPEIKKSIYKYITK